MSGNTRFLSMKFLFTFTVALLVFALAAVAPLQGEPKPDKKKEKPELTPRECSVSSPLPGSARSFPRECS